MQNIGQNKKALMQFECNIDAINFKKFILKIVLDFDLGNIFIDEKSRENI